MKYKVLAAMMALLGFGASCSSTRQQKSAPQSEEQPAVQQDSIELPAIRLMYGVPPVALRQEAIETAPQTPEEEPTALPTNTQTTTENE